MTQPKCPSDTIAGQRREDSRSEREEDPRPRRDDERERPLGAAQIAAPSTRRWRRASRFT